MKILIRKIFAALLAAVLLTAVPQMRLSTVSAGEPALRITDDLGDFSFFKSDYITHRYTGYPNTVFYPNGNEIVCEKFDYQNPSKGDNIIFNKTSADGMSMNIAAHIFSNYDSSKKFRYFKLTAELQNNLSGTGGCAELYRINDNSAGLSVTPLTVFADGSLQLYDGTVLAGAAPAGVWVSVKMYLNIDTGKAVIFINDVLTKEGQLTNSDFHTLSSVDISLPAGGYTGDLRLRKMEFTGLDKAYNGEEIRTSMFGDDSEIKEYLEDKISFHAYSGICYKNGSRLALTSPCIYEDGELYISLADFNSAYGSQVTISQDSAGLKGETVSLVNQPKTSGGVLLVPVREIAERLLNLCTFDDTNGMIISGTEPINFDLSAETPYYLRRMINNKINRLTTLQYINDFLMFDRPKKEELLRGFNQATNSGAKHPRIMADAEDFERIKNAAETDEYMALIKDGLIKKADSYCTQAAITYKYDDALRTLSTANALMERMFALGFAYQMTGAQKYVNAAWANLNALNGFPDINPGHPIDTGSYGAGIAIGYDWFYNAFSEARRQNIEENAKRLHLTVIDDGFYGRSPVRGGPDGNINLIGFYNKWISNYNAWTNSGSVMMALAFMDTYPELCSDLLEQSIRSLEYTLKNFAPDGTWCESTNYWTVTVRSLGYVFGSLNGIYGTDFKLSRFPGLSGTGIVNMSLRGMNGTYNYHDADTETDYANYPMPFLGCYFNQPELLAARKATLTQAFDSRMPEVAVKIFDALWYDPDVNVNQTENLPKVTYAKGIELFAVHEDYTDYDGLFFASHGGPVSCYHAHNDVGDFVFDLDGVRWACALGKENYNLSLSESKIYRKRTEGHNTLTINNGLKLNQTANTYAPIIQQEDNEDGAFVRYDMSDVYADADSCLRSFYVDKEERSLTVTDNIDLNRESEIYWFMHTQARAEVTGPNTVILNRQGKSVTLSFETDAPQYEVSVMDACPLESSPQGEGQNANDGYRKVAIRLTGSGAVNLTVHIAKTDQSPLYFQSFDEITSLSEDSVFSVKNNTAAGSYANIENGLLKIGKTAIGSSSVTADLSGAVGSRTGYTVSFDMKANVRASSVNIKLGGCITLRPAGSGAYTVGWHNGTEWDETDKTEYDFSESQNIKLVVHGGSTLDVYVGNILAHEGIPRRVNNSSYLFTKLIIEMNNSLIGEIQIDNLSVTPNIEAARLGVVYRQDFSGINELSQAEEFTLTHNAGATDYTSLAGGVLNFGKTGTGVASVNLELGEYLDDTMNYTLSFDLKTALSKGLTINIFLGGCIAVRNKGNNQCTVEWSTGGSDGGQWIATDTTTYDLDGFAQMKLVVRNREKLSVYIGDTLVVEDIPQRWRYSFTNLEIDLGNSMIGEIWLDNFVLNADAPEDSLDCSLNGRNINIAAALVNAYAVPCAAAAFYSGDKLIYISVLYFQNGHLNADIPVPEGAEYAKIMLWELDGLKPILPCENINISLLNPEETL